jgi:hypothetical protein
MDPHALADGSSLTVGQGAGALFAAAPALRGPQAAAVPEPGTAVLLAAALCSAAICRRYRRRS